MIYYKIRIYYPIEPSVGKLIHKKNNLLARVQVMMHAEPLTLRGSANEEYGKPHTHTQTGTDIHTFGHTPAHAGNMLRPAVV